MTEINAWQQVQLKEGMEIRFLPDWPAYVVQAPVRGSNALRLRLEGKIPYHLHEVKFHQNVKINKSCPVGRDPDTAKLLLNYKSISRQHGLFHYSQDKQCWYYTHSGTNVGDISHPTQAVEIIDTNPAARRFNPDHALHEDVGRVKADERVEYAASVFDQKGADISPAAKEPFAITHGTSIQFHPFMPVYEARINEIDGKKTLLMQHQDHSKTQYENFDVEQGEIKTLGRGGTSDVFLPLPSISRNHASISWDNGDKQFIYKPLGQYPPIVRLPKLLLALKERFDGMAFTKAQTEEQAPKIQGLLEELKQHKSLAEKAQNLEVASVVCPWYDRDRGARTEDSQKGYEMWLRAFELLYKETLPLPLSQTLLRMAEAVRHMADDRATLRNIEEEHIKPSFETPDLEKLKDGSQRHLEIQGYVDKKAQQLEAAGEVYLVSGFRGHHTVTRVKKDDSGYLVTTYNAGADAMPAPDGENVLGMYEKRLKSDVNVGEFIWLTTERKLWSAHSSTGIALAMEVEDAQESTILRSHTVPPQHRGNCTTRSTREALRDALPPETFAELHRHVSDPNMGTIEDVQSALEMKLRILQIAHVVQAYQPADSSHRNRLNIEGNNGSRHGVNPNRLR